MDSILLGSDYLALPRAAETFIIDPLLPTGGSMLIYGEPKTGKSFLGLQLALDVTAGRPWIGFPCSKAYKVVYVQLDTPRSLWAARLEDLRRAGLDVDSIYFADLETLGCWPFDILNPDHFAILSDALLKIKPDVVIMDTLKESHQTSENDNTEGQKVMAALTACTRPAALVLVHHSRKQGEFPDDIKNGARGAGYLTGKMDGIVKVTNKTIGYVGRAIEEGVIRTERDDNGMWSLAQADLDHAVAAVMAETPGSIREKAKVLAERTHKSDEACRSLLRRYTKSMKMGRPLGYSGPKGGSPGGSRQRPTTSTQ